VQGVHGTSTLAGSVSVEGAMKLQASQSPMLASLAWIELQPWWEVYLSVGAMQNHSH